MIKDRRVFLRMNLLQLKFRNKNLLLKMYTCVFISIKHVTEAFFSENLDNTDTWHVVSHWCPYYLVSTVVVTVATTWGRGRTCASGSGRVDVVVMVVVVVVFMLVVVLVVVHGGSVIGSFVEGCGSRSGIGNGIGGGSENSSFKSNIGSEGGGSGSGRGSASASSNL